MAAKKGGDGGKQTSDKVSSTAGKVLSGGKASKKQSASLAGSALAQDETKGKKPKSK